MKIKSIQQTCLCLVLGLAFLAPTLAHAGGNTGQVIAKFEPAKSDKDIADLKPDDTIVKVCRSCNHVTLIRVNKPGKGIYDYVAKKCEDCGSDDTYIGISKEFVPVKEREKR